MDFPDAKLQKILFVLTQLVNAHVYKLSILGMFMFSRVLFSRSYAIRLLQAYDHWLTFTVKTHLMRFLLLAILMIPFYACAQSGSFALAVLQYRGGGDWYANPTALSNLSEYCNKQLGLNLAEPEFVDVGSPALFNYPFVHMTGHGNVVFGPNDQENLRSYLIGGGFLHIDDNYGMDVFIRPQLQQLFPDKELVEVPFGHPVYHQKYDFPRGLPKVHEHDELPPQGFGIFHEGRMILFYSYESDLGDGWEDPSVHKDPEELRQQALRMGANLVQYALMGEDEEQ